ncbi:MAG: hypothetical protein WAW90_00865 [Minisyncoccia bacterium]
MNNQKNKESARVSGRRAMPFFVEFVKFCTGFAVIVASALVILHVANAAM